MFSDILAANRAYAEAFPHAGLAARAARGFALVTCIDSRIEPLAALGLRAGDSKIIRNAGGRVTEDVLRSLVIAVRLLGVTRVVVMHHTACALAGRTDAQLRQALLEAGMPDVEGGWLGAMPDPNQALLDDVQALRASPLIPATVAVAGWVYDVATGLITPTCP